MGQMRGVPPEPRPGGHLGWASIQRYVDRALDLAERAVYAYEVSVGVTPPPNYEPVENPEARNDVEVESRDPNELSSVFEPKYVGGQWLYVVENYGGQDLKGYAACVDTIRQTTAGFYYGVFIRREDTQVVHYDIPESFLRALTDEEREQLMEINPMYAESQREQPIRDESPGTG